jgi:2-polyprenyl-3-methyl-5-hydroxy-6-metoxy-1,4-benzoquinol methylase
LKSSNSIVTEHVRCDLCGSEEHTFLYSKWDPVTRKEYNVVECRCGMAFVNPMPTVESIPFLYPADYLKDKRAFARLYSRMMKLLPNISGGKLLDIGCGQGDFINHASKEGWCVEGVDLMAWDNPDLLPIRIGDFLEMDLPWESYDVLTAWALLEHVRRPSAFFRKVFRLLKKDGKFIFVVPNFKAPGMRRSCTEDIPRHLWLFSPRAIDEYLHKSGMETRYIGHNNDIYSAYPFGLLRLILFKLWKSGAPCSRYDNKSIALLRNRQIRGNLREWLSGVIRSVGPMDLILDAADITLGVLVAEFSKIIQNYGIITVVAGKKTN